MCGFYVRNGVLGANFFSECATMPAGSDDERPRPARAAPAESPARLALKPKAKKPRAQDDPNFIDLKTLKKGTRFTFIASLDETAYGVSSVHIGSFAGRGLPNSFDNQWYSQANWPM